MSNVSILKYTLGTDEEQFVTTHQGAEILTVQPQGGTLALWAKVNTENPTVARKIVIISSGECACDVGEYITTLSLCDGALVLHVFDNGEK